jgi:hypothetical protein
MTFKLQTSKDQCKGNPYKLGLVSWVYRECITFKKSANEVGIKMDKNKE